MASVKYKPKNNYADLNNEFMKALQNVLCASLMNPDLSKRFRLRRSLYKFSGGSFSLSLDLLFIQINMFPQSTCMVHIKARGNVHTHTQSHIFSHLFHIALRIWVIYLWSFNYNMTKIHRKKKKKKNPSGRLGSLGPRKCWNDDN